MFHLLETFTQTHELGTIFKKKLKDNFAETRSIISQVNKKLFLFSCINVFC